MTVAHFGSARDKMRWNLRRWRCGAVSGPSSQSGARSGTGVSLAPLVGPLSALLAAIDLRA